MRSMWIFSQEINTIQEIMGIMVPTSVWCWTGSVGQFFFMGPICSAPFFGITQMVKFQNLLNMIM